MLICRGVLAASALLHVLARLGDVQSFATLSEPFRRVNFVDDKIDAQCGKRVYPRNICLRMAKKISATNKHWLPYKPKYDDDIFGDLEERGIRERKCVEYMAGLIESYIVSTEEDKAGKNYAGNAFKLAKGRFLYLTCTIEGEKKLEDLFATNLAEKEEDDEIIRGAIIALQSLCIMGTQCGVKGSAERQKNMVRHLFRHEDLHRENEFVDTWDEDAVRRLKYERDQNAGTQLLAQLRRKRTSQGAFDLLVALGVWGEHEDLPLLRSGFPTRFTDLEEEAANKAQSFRDIDQILGIRKDFRHQKVYTIDSASASEIDDGLSVEVLQDEDGSERYRFWIHIADADRWAPRGSELFGAAKRRATSIYLPSGAVPMFPIDTSFNLMSLRANVDTCALSLGVELLEDGSIDSSSIVVAPSTIQVTYRLTYDEVDEMLEEGVGYSEEWELGALLDAARRRRAHRIEHGASEGMVPTPIPRGEVCAVFDPDVGDYMISVDVESTHNSGMNQTTIANGDVKSNGGSYASPVSPANLLVTEMMILAGEAIGKWKEEKRTTTDTSLMEEPSQLNNALSLPYRSQNPPDFKSRPHEATILDSLHLSNTGGGYCHAWYSRRFFEPVKVSEKRQPHHGLGLDCYVQWTSPIRRFGDLQVHAAVKRHLRREHVNNLMRKGLPIPMDLTSADLGCAVPSPIDESLDDQGRIRNYLLDEDSAEDDQIDYNAGLDMIFASRPVAQASRTYWMFEHIQRLVNNSSEEVAFESTVLGCVNPDRFQYAIYVHKLGLEHRYLSEMGQLDVGQTLWLKVESAYPRMGLLSFTLASKESGIAARPTTAAPAA